MTGRLAKEGRKNPVAKKVLNFVVNLILIYTFAYRFTLTLKQNEITFKWQNKCQTCKE